MKENDLELLNLPSLSIFPGKNLLSQSVNEQTYDYFSSLALVR